MVKKELLLKILDDMEEQKLRNEIDLEMAENVILITSGPAANEIQKKILMCKMAIQSYKRITDLIKKRIEAATTAKG